jgi:hypothetical protein
MTHLRTALANFVFHGSIWLISDGGHVERMSREQYLALPKASPLRSWVARLDEDEAKTAAERRKGRVN